MCQGRELELVELIAKRYANGKPTSSPTPTLIALTLAFPLTLTLPLAFTSQPNRHAHRVCAYACAFVCQGRELGLVELIGKRYANGKPTPSPTLTLIALTLTLTLAFTLTLTLALALALTRLVGPSHVTAAVRPSPDCART